MLWKLSNMFDFVDVDGRFLDAQQRNFFDTFE